MGKSRQRSISCSDDDPLALTPESLHVMHLRLNRFSGYIAILWQDHQVRAVKPEGALRNVKKRYSNSKRFAADCSTMKQRIFWLPACLPHALWPPACWPYAGVPFAAA